MRYLPLLIQPQQELSWMNYMLGSSKFESKQYFGFNCRKILTNKLDPADSSWFWTTSPERTTLNYITNTMGVPLNNIIGGGLTDPITGNNYSACNMAGIGTYIVNIQGTELFDGDPTLHPLTAAMTHGFDLDLFLDLEF
ncbi:unnamed protein product [Rhizophagus irregularis]|uniref:Uncharacterized protein n=2 Tax=Rhizophagus irregularis TaxID=588596 RepID=A0A915ZYI9_9GLOM|nr:hypothetical protein GLOIN_2v1767337 [Rhizophagus irregularis DAOM 181602=DAOM 197198]CAB4480011.1 unnamed protein product [Rhizophagus irregularis]CAB5190201.1 unnamed protein product [Rhizophagus irregularis]CAB5395943.1 unnamed protein product [Rhizophagus irregularis]